MEIYELINVLISSKSMFLQRKTLLNNHLYIINFEYLYGINSYFKTLFNSRILYKELRYSQSYSIRTYLNVLLNNRPLYDKTMDNSTRLLTFEQSYYPERNILDEMLEIFTDRITIEYDFNQNVLKLTNQTFGEMMEKYKHWNMTNVNLYVIYLCIFFMKTNNYMEVFKLKDVSNGIISSNMNEYEKYYFNSIDMMVKIINKIDNFILRVSLIYVFYQFINISLSSNFDHFMMKYEEVTRTLIEKLVIIENEIKVSSNLPNVFKKTCCKRLQDIHTNLTKNL